MTTPVGGASVFGGLGRLELAPANGPEDPFPYYIDITPYVRAEQTDLQIARGRDSNLNAFQPGQLTCLLDNSTGIFTPGFDPTTFPVFDNFDRNVSNGFGTSDSGHVWTVSAGPASDYAVGVTTAATIAPSVQGSARVIDLDPGLGLTSGEIVLDFQVPALPSGGQLSIGASRSDGSNYQVAAAVFDPSGSISLVIRTIISGMTTDVITQTTPLTYTNNPAGNHLRMRFNLFGPVLRARLWSIANGGAEPAGWLTVNNAQVTGTRMGVYGRDDTPGLGHTFTLLTFQFNNTGPWGGPVSLTARKIRYSETVGSRTFTAFTGWVEYPDIPDWRPIGYQEVQLTATDRLARLARGTPFVSTLGAHIVGSARNGALRGYWPLNDASAPFRPSVGTDAGVAQFAFSSSPPVTQLPSFNYAQGPALPGDDISGLHMTVGLNGTTPVFNPQVAITFASPPVIAAGQVATLVVWLRQDIVITSGQFLGLNLLENSSGTIQSLVPNTDAMGSHWEFFGDGILDSANGSQNHTSRWVPAAIRWGFTPNVMELWAEGVQYTGTWAGSISAASATGLRASMPGSLAHLQFYIGAPTDFTFADFLAQTQVGLLGLEGQTTGQRVNTILNYAGASATDRQIDPGVSYMAVAKLAGRSPGDVLAEAVTTEQGRGFALGTGPYAFHDRQRVTNV